MVHHHVVHVATAGGVWHVGGHPVTGDLPGLCFQRLAEVILVLATGLHVHVHVGHVLDMGLVSEVRDISIRPGLRLLPRIAHHVKLLRRAVPQAQVHVPGALGVVNDVLGCCLGGRSLKEPTDHERHSFAVVGAGDAAVDIHTPRLDAGLVVPSTPRVVGHLLTLDQPRTVQPGDSTHKPREGHHRKSIRPLPLLRFLMVHYHHPVVGEGHSPKVQGAELDEGPVGGGSLGGTDHGARHPNQFRQVVHDLDAISECLLPPQPALTSICPQCVADTLGNSCNLIEDLCGLVVSVVHVPVLLLGHPLQRVRQHGHCDLLTDSLLDQCSQPVRQPVQVHTLHQGNHVVVEHLISKGRDRLRHENPGSFSSLGSGAFQVQHRQGLGVRGLHHLEHTIGVGPHCLHILGRGMNGHWVQRSRDAQRSQHAAHDERETSKNRSSVIPRAT
mmetsp:Transcript_42390/g.102014  ORF Transcript_42390/g.102014 Transcript_42390/m.102014 type:complete len:443 (+) Transcript_42390:337-1665(+)